MARGMAGAHQHQASDGFSVHKSFVPYAPESKCEGLKSTRRTAHPALSVSEFCGRRTPCLVTMGALLSGDGCICAELMLIDTISQVEEHLQSRMSVF